MAAVGAEIVDHDLDVIRTLGNAGVDPSLSLRGRRERWDLKAVLRTMAAGDSRESSGGAQIGPVEIFALGLIFLGRLHEVQTGEHVEFSCDAENLCFLQRVALGVRVRVDQAGQESVARGVNGLHA